MGRTRKKGFTIVELLTVMGVIAVLIGLLVPALALVKDHAKELQQRAQFHGIDVGLEIYKNEMGSYPESSENLYVPKANESATGAAYCGANKLAEAMVGLDLIGFHPSSSFQTDGLSVVALNRTPPTTGTVTVYAADVDQSAMGWETARENMDARKGPFVDLEKVNAYRMDEVYDPAHLGTFANVTNVGTTTMYPLVLCDVYAQKRNGVGSKKTGTPILYFRARTNYKFQDSTLNTAAANLDNYDIYNYYDNQELLLNGMPNDGTQFTVTIPVAPATTEAEMFDKMIVNENVQTIRRPYRADSYILISAGKDGDFGTADDVFNFDKEVTE